MAAGGKVGQGAVWILMALLILGLGGFGVTNFGGTVRSIGEVNGQNISTNDYFKALQTDLNALQQQMGRGLTLTEASALGLDTQVRQRLVTTAVLDAEAARLGVSIGDEQLANEIRAIPAFRGGASGGFSADAYRLTLQQQGLKEAEFETQMRADLARGLVQAAVATGFAGSDTAAATLYDYVEERRSFSLLRLTEADLPEPLPELAEADLRAYYDANPATFTRPESRRITYAALLADDVAKTIAVDEAELRRLYDQRIGEFIQPERRLVERIVFQDEAAATAARNRLDAGQIEFEALVAERGLEMVDTDMGDVGRAELGEAAETIFAMDEPGVVGPLPSPLGPALYRMNGILAAEEVTFDEAREALTAEFAIDAARRQIRTQADPVEDLLAGGASVEELGEQAGMTVATILLEPDATDGIAAYPAFRQQAARIGQGDFPELVALDDGGFAVLRLDEIVAPALRPYEEVEDRIAGLARADALRQALDARLSEIEAALANGGALGNFGITEVHAAMPRGGRVDAAPADLLARVFALDAGGVARVVEGDFVGVIRVDAIVPADHSTPEAQALKAAFVAQQGQEFGADAFALFATALEAGADISLNEAAINAVHSQLR